MSDFLAHGKTEDPPLARESIIRECRQVALRGVHAWEDVPYVYCTAPGDPVLYMCRLCDWQVYFRGGFSLDITGRAAQMDTHVRSLRHETRYHQLERAQQLYVEEMRRILLLESKPLSDMTSQLGLPTWRSHVSDLVARLIETPLPTYPDEYPCDCNKEIRHHWEAATSQLARYEQMERLSLLELAFVKSGRCSDVARDNNSFCTDELRNVDLVTYGISNIMPLVVQFLGKPEAVSSTYHCKEDKGFFADGAGNHNVF